MLFDFCTEKQIQEKCFQYVVPMVSQCDFGCSQFTGNPIENSPAQTGTKRTDRFVLRYQAPDDAVGILCFDVERNVFFFQVNRQNVFRKSGQILVKIDGDNIEMNGRAHLKTQKDIKHDKTVLASRQAYHDFVPVFDHIEVANRLADLTVKTFCQFVVFKTGFEKLPAGCHNP